MSLSGRRGRELYERLLRGHQLVIIRRTVLIIAFVPHNACKSFLNELFSYVAAGGSGQRLSQTSSLLPTHIPWLPTRMVVDSRSLYSPSRGRIKSTWTRTCFPISFLRRNSRASWA